jgi:hypothetical protein
MGASVQTPADYKIAIIKYDQSGAKIWQANYDTAGFYTLPVAMDISGSHLNVTGCSFNDLGQSNFVTVPVNIHSGAVSDAKTSAGGTGVVSHPVGIVADTSGNNYVAGTSTVAGAASVFKLVKYDSLYNVVFGATWGDSTQANTATCMMLEGIPVGIHAFVAGSSPNANGGTDMVVLEYDPNGNLIWSRRISAPNPAHAAGATTITNDGNGNVFIAGTMYNGTDTDIATAELDSNGNILWLKTYNRGAGINDVPYSISMSDDNLSVYLTAGSVGPADSLYITLQYQPYTKANTLAATTIGGQYIDNQLIIRFDPSWIDQDAVNKTDIDIAPPSYWLTPTADSALQANIPLDLTTCQMERIYKGLKASYKYSIARNGDSILIPNLWAAFLLIYPDADPRATPTDIAGAINPLFPMVVSTGLNYVGQFLTGPCHIPTTCRISDPYFQNQQVNLWKDSIDCPDVYNINIDSAWRLETGKTFIKVGIYDTGLDGLNQDFSPDPNNVGNPGTKANGWNFINNSSPLANNWTNFEISDPAPNGQSYAHGTMVSGIIGAIRNNTSTLGGIGIAGIAGGDDTDGVNVGATLYGMKILQSGGSGNPSGYLTLPISDICNALTLGCSYIPGLAYGFGFHVMNASWGVKHDSIGYNNTQFGRALDDMDLRELEQAFKNVYRNQTTIVAAAGNDATDMLFPANFYSDWILCVGGADDTGGWYNSGTTGEYTSSFAGASVDLIAPSISNSDYPAVTTAYHQNEQGYDGYATSYGGTSLAAPHVTGTVALLMSYLDSTASVYQNLSPEDAEHLLIRSADNKGYVGHSDSTGWGDLNAGKSLQSVNKACTKLLHLGNGTNNNNATSV